MTIVTDSLLARMDPGRLFFSVPCLFSARSFSQRAVNQRNVFDYFATSMFYDNKQQPGLRMQTMHTACHCKRGRGTEVGCHPWWRVSHILTLLVCYRRFTGIEFAVVHAQPPSLFIIHKREEFLQMKVLAW